jgi:ATP-dependent DNA ligase
MTITKKKVPAQARFIESMECLPVTQLPKGPEWSYEIELDGFRLAAVKKNSTTTLFSRRGTSVSCRIPALPNSRFITTCSSTLPLLAKISIRASRCL